LQTNLPYFGVRVMQGAETDRPLSVKDSGKTIPRSLPIIYITHFTSIAMAARNIAKKYSKFKAFLPTNALFIKT
jgi:hypothetical protein